MLLTIEGVWLAMRSCAEGLQKEGFRPLKEVMEAFVAEVKQVVLYSCRSGRAEGNWASTTVTRAASAIQFGAFAHLLPPIEARGAPAFEALRRVGDALVGTAGGARPAGPSEARTSAKGRRTG